jgi:sRNA-binding protein
LSKRWSYIECVDSDSGVNKMAAISSSTSVGSQAATQAGWQQLRLQQARQNAARAEQTAQALAAKAADAQQVAARADESARSLYVQSEQASSVAGQARQGLAMIRSASEMQNSLSNTVSQVSVRQEVKVTDTQTSPVESPPVVNTSGQVTGVVVNTTA